MNIIKLENISYTYESQLNSSSFSINNLDLQINEGEFISIMGPNGSGKSTLLKLIANLLKPKNGNIFLDNKNYNKIPRDEFAKTVAFVPQSMQMFFAYSVYEIVMMGRTPYLNYFGIENNSDHIKVINALKLLEIDHLKKKGINEISGGEAQRALIARALVQEPKIMLLDEPNSHLDIKHQVGIFNILKDLNNNYNLTVVLISHDLNLVRDFSKRVVFMKDGKIKFDDVPDNVFTHENIKSVFNINAKIYNNEDMGDVFIKLNPKLIK